MMNCESCSHPCSNQSSECIVKIVKAVVLAKEAYPIVQGSVMEPSDKDSCNIVLDNVI